jgi:hypothetical protein
VINWHISGAIQAVSEMGTVAWDGTIWISHRERARAGIVIVTREQSLVAQRHGWEVVATQGDLVWVRRS